MKKGKNSSSFILIFYKKYMKKLIIFITLFLLIILWPDFFLKSGFFYNLDSVFFPVYNLPNFFSESIYWYFYYTWQYFLGYEIFSKIYFLILLLFWVFLWLKITDFYIKKFNISDENIKFLLKFLSIVFVICTPFLYERIMTQTMIYFWVVNLWLWFIYLLEFLEDKKDRNLYFSAWFFWLSLTAFSHSIIFIIILVFLTLAFFIKNLA